VLGASVNQFSVIKKTNHQPVILRLFNRSVTDGNWLMVALLYIFKMSLKMLKTLKI
jgi:hypothetical protein